MKVDYLRLCSRASDNPAFIWFCDFPSIAGRLLRDYLAEPLHHAFMKANAPCASREGLQLLFLVGSVHQERVGGAAKRQNLK